MLLIVLIWIVFDVISLFCISVMILYIVIGMFIDKYLLLKYQLRFHLFAFIDYLLIEILYSELSSLLEIVTYPTYL
jgi:hypothetical protein